MMMKGEAMAKRSSFGAIRRRLSDVTNFHSQPISPLKHKQIPPQFDDSFTNDYIQQLLEENAVKEKLIQDRDKIIETSEVEMQKLKSTLQKCQLQNWHLAQSNSHMLAELNLSKDRLKTLQHELACKDVLFKTKIRELEDEKANNQIQANVAQVKERETRDDPSHPGNKNDQNKVDKTLNKRPARSRSMGPTTSQQASEKEIAENKRQCLRRQSMRQNPQAELLFEIDAAKFPIEEEEKEKQGSSTTETQRSSLGRPLRRAAEKVQSYKEPSCAVKLRR